MTRIPEDELQTIENVRDCRVLELGNKRNSTGLYRDWYVKRGCKYISLDWNEHDGAIRWDLRRDLDTKRDLNEDPFDVITNFGCSEHVTVQEPVWRTMHNAIRAGGIMCHCLPYPFEGYENKAHRMNWEYHGYWHPTIEWMNKLSEANHYTVDFIRPFDRLKPTLAARLVKTTDEDFVWVEGLHRTTTPFTERDLKGWKHNVRRRN